jgi:adenosylcobinamide kinase/adenosylcobinamide-phosphate guanylyltransferase
MRLIIGGAFQGKYEYAKETYPQMAIIDKLHVQIREDVKQCLADNEADYTVLQKRIEAKWISMLEAKLQESSDVCIICDEVGMGIVPMDKWERIYREAVGHICIWLAAKAESVERITCGLVERIK